MLFRAAAFLRPYELPAQLTGLQGINTLTAFGVD